MHILKRESYKDLHDLAHICLYQLKRDNSLKNTQNLTPKLEPQNNPNLTRLRVTPVPLCFFRLPTYLPLDLLYTLFLHNNELPFYKYHKQQQKVKSQEMLPRYMNDELFSKSHT